MAEYPHLKLPYKVEGVHKAHGGGGGALQQTIENRKNRQNHGVKLQGAITNLKNTWEEVKKHKGQGESSLPNETDIPIFLKIDTNAFRDLESFRNWGIEIISEEQDGFIIGVSKDDFKLFEENLIQFIDEKGKYKNTAAKIWEIATDNNWRINQLLNGDLKEVWGNIEDKKEYTVEIGVSCYVPNIKSYPEKHDFDSEEKYLQKLDEYKAYENSLIIERDEKQILREKEVQKYTSDYKGIVHEEWDNEIDAVYFKLTINGKGLRDLVFTYQYLFKISFPAIYSVESLPVDLAFDTNANILAPHENSPVVCIIDSGIQEKHRLLSPAINNDESKSYVDGNMDTGDFVKISGHGTKVAGAVLYPREIPAGGDVRLPCRLQNARILDDKNEISKERFAPPLIEQIVKDFSATRIFNLSVSEKKAYSGTHMHELPAAIDKLMHEKDVLFIISAGNLYQSTGDINNPGISEFIQNQKVYPDYLEDDNCKIANPGISFFALTVGSVGHAAFEDDDFKSMAGPDFISPFSRCGFGIWGAIKPDVVEYGGDLVINKTTSQVKQHPETSSLLVNSTLYGAPAVGREGYGTSYSAPKVSFIASQLQAEHPNENCLMYRALIVQSARLPSHCFNNPTTRDFANYGYGIPDIDRALNNNQNRITFVQNGKLGAKKADIFKLNIPRELRGEGKGFGLLIEVTLSFTAKTRLTRKGAHSYLSSWLEWKSSRYGENFNSFRNRTIQYLDTEEAILENEEIETGEKAIKWVVRENPNWTDIKINRNNSSVQKSWAVIEPHQFTEDFSIAVVGHAGWDRNLENEIPYALCVSFEVVGADVPIYNLIAEAQTQVEHQIEAEV